MLNAGSGPGDVPARAESNAQTTRYLAAARFYLPEVPASERARAAWAKVEHHLHLGELRLALDCAMSLGNNVCAAKEFWRELLLATRNMEVDEQASKLAEWVRLQQGKGRNAQSCSNGFSNDQNFT
jgi:hypothetical protein